MADRIGPWAVLVWTAFVVAGCAWVWGCKAVATAFVLVMGGLFAVVLLTPLAWGIREEADRLAQWRRRP